LKMLHKKISKHVTKVGKKSGDLFKLAHHHVAKRPHAHLVNKVGWYQKWHQHPHHGHVHGVMAVCGLAAMAVSFFTNVMNVRALSSWSQTDWSGGVGSSTSNQYVSASNINTTINNQLTLDKNSGWFNDDWAYRRRITIDNSNESLGGTADTLVDFPLLVKLTSNEIDYSKVQDQGQDLRFSTPSAPTIALSYEIEKWDESGTSYVWVKVPSITANSSTDYINMYYGNTQASAGQSVNATWNNNFRAVWHLKETSGSHFDSTSNANTSSSINVTQQGNASGISAGADAFNGLGNNVVVPASSSLNVTGDTLTLEAWIKLNSCGDYAAFLHKEQHYTVAMATAGSNCSITYADGSTWSYATFGAYGNFPRDGNYHHLSVVKNGGVVTIYLDGQVVIARSFGSSVSSNNNPFYIASYNYERYVNATFDEVRVSSNAQSSGWVLASYKSQGSGLASFGPETSLYQTSGTILSNIFDTGVLSNWENLSYTATVPSGSAVNVKVRAGNQPDLSDAAAFSSCTAISSDTDITSACAPDISRYVQYQLTLTGDGGVTPLIQSLSIDHSPSDTIAPVSNATNLSMKKSSSGSTVSSGDWTNAATPYFSWDAADDDNGGSGIKGYCLYLGQDSSANLVTTKGLLGSSPVATDGHCQFIIGTNSIDLSTANYISSAMATSNSAYYLLVKAIDNGGNLFSGSAASFNFKFDNTPPTNPSFITAPSQFIATKAVTLTWPTGTGDAADDSNSGVAGLQYRIGSNGAWYGDNHTGAQNATDLLDNDGSYSTIANLDYNSLQEGNNIVAFRTWDAAGNTSTANVTTVVRLNTSAPGSPQNVSGTPPTNTTNSFAFSWLPPASFTGSANNVTYCYTVNTTPTSSNCTFTNGGVTSVPAGAFATQPGENTFYVVAKDEAGNINYATAASTTFTANTSAPGIPLNLEIADVSNKATSTWKLALSWNAPVNTGAGVASYKVYRSTNGTSYSQVASTAGTSYVDSSLSTVTYYYRVMACDSANNCGSFSSPTSKLPTGRFTDPPELISQPSVTVSTRTATVTWTTDRTSDSRIQYGTSSGNYVATEAANSDQTKTHSIELSNLSAGTTYYYKAKWTDEDGNIGVSGELSFTTQPAPTIKDVSIKSTSLSGAIIQFTSKDAAQIKLFYGKSEGFGGLKTINTSRSESIYTVELAGLDDGTQYSYKLNPIDLDGNEYNSSRIDNFTTPARPRIANLRFQPVEGEPTSTQKVTWTTNVPSSSLVRYSTAQIGSREESNSQLTIDHEITIRSLIDDTEYNLVAESRDKDGNLAASDSQILRTALDTRPPKVSDISTQGLIKGTGAEARGQIIISWKTDEPTTSQVAYGEGSGTDFNSKTAEDTRLTTDHVVIISDLATSKVYNVQPLSKDKANNLGKGNGSAVIIGRPSESVMTIIFNSLQKIFGL
jgi:hypothetical protein